MGDRVQFYTEIRQASGHAFKRETDYRSLDNCPEWIREVLEADPGAWIVVYRKHGTVVTTIKRYEVGDDETTQAGEV